MAKHTARAAKPVQTQQQHSDNSHNHKKTCRSCGGEYPHNGVCPAKGKTCNYCKTLNHFNKMCRKRRENESINSVYSNTLRVHIPVMRWGVLLWRPTQYTFGEYDKRKTTYGNKQSRLPTNDRHRCHCEHLGRRCTQESGQAKTDDAWRPTTTAT